MSQELVPAKAAPLPPVILGHAALLGVSADALMRGSPGLGVLIWVVVTALAAVSLAWRSGRVASGQAGLWLGSAVLFAAGMVWRDAEMLRFLDAIAVIGSLGMAALALNDARVALFATRLRDTIWGGAALGVSAIAGPTLLNLTRSERQVGAVSRIGPVLRAGAIATVFLVVFGSLLRAADPIFASFVRLPGIDLDAIVTHLLAIGFWTWILGGWARGALVMDLSDHPAPDRFPIQLGVLEITAALGSLAGLFTAFVIAQLGWFFGGERFLHEQTGLTAAEYARSGFFQMVWVVFLVAGVLLGTRALLQPEKSVTRRHTLLSLPVVALLLAIIFSAAMRMKLYVHYYGLSTDRFYTLVFMGWLGIVLLWFTATVLRGWAHPFGAGVIVSGALLLAGLNVAAPDAIVARVNLARFAEPDLDHLASLSGEAAELAVTAALRPPTGADALIPPAETRRCAAAQRLLRRWGPFTPAARMYQGAAAWRSWNAGEAHALRAVAAEADRLRAACRAGT